MYSKVLEHRGVCGVLFGHDGEVAASRGVAGSRVGPAGGGRSRRLEQLRFVEQRLRPLRESPLSEVYWRVLEELERLAGEAPRPRDDEAPRPRS